MPEPFKNYINEDVAKRLGQSIRSIYPKFPYKKYLKLCVPKLAELELKERANTIGDALRTTLPANTGETFTILTKAVQTLPYTPGSEYQEDGWPMFPINSLLTKHGMEAREEAMDLIREVTRRFSAEFGIRTFLINDTKSTLTILKKWAKDPDMHIRRLVSEGTRPRLPWGEQIKSFIENPRPILPLLEILKDDPEEYVRRSVANNLNDISKDHPELMLDVVEKWHKKASPNRLRLIKHACRTLIKSGHPRCLELLGYSAPRLAKPSLKLSSDSIKLGDTLKITTELKSTASTAQELILDYRFHLVKANGSTSPKVFKGSQQSLPAKAQKLVAKNFTLRPVTTRRYYSGPTKVELLINGTVAASATFKLDAGNPINP